MSDLTDQNTTNFRLSKAEKDSIIESINLRANTSQSTQKGSRKHPRFRPVFTDVVANFEHPGGSTDSCPALLYDMSTGGVGLAVRGFLHKGTLVSLNLKTIDNEKCTVSGVVRWCNYFQKQIHTVGVSLYDQIDLKNFVPEEQWMQHLIDSEDVQWATTRTALVVDENSIEFSVVSMMLKNAKIEAVSADTLGSALDIVQKTTYDLIVLSDALDDSMASEEVLSKFFLNGYVGPIVVLTNSKETREYPLRNAGAACVIQKPLELAPFLSDLRDVFLDTHSALAGTSPIYSTLSQEHCSNETLAQYIHLVVESAKKLDAHIINDDYPAAAKICESLYSTGTGYGFQALSSLAHDVLKSLNASCSVKESATDIRKIIRFVGRLQSRNQE